MIRWDLIGKAGCGIGCLVGAGLFILVGPGLILGLMLVAASERTVFARATSPDGEREARVQFDDCGAPCGFERTVFIKSSWIPSDSPWFSCVAFNASGEAEVRLQWVEARTLLIDHGFEADDYVSVAKSCGPVRIIARPLEERN